MEDAKKSSDGRIKHNGKSAGKSISKYYFLSMLLGK